MNVEDKKEMIKKALGEPTQTPDLSTVNYKSNSELGHNKISSHRILEQAKKHDFKWRSYKRDEDIDENIEVCLCESCGAVRGYKIGDKIITEYETLKELYPEIDKFKPQLEEVENEHKKKLIK